MEGELEGEGGGGEGGEGQDDGGSAQHHPARARRLRGAPRPGRPAPLQLQQHQRPQEAHQHVRPGNVLQLGRCTKSRECTTRNQDQTTSDNSTFPRELLSCVFSGERGGGRSQDGVVRGEEDGAPLKREELRDGGMAFEAGETPALLGEEPVVVDEDQVPTLDPIREH